MLLTKVIKNVIFYFPTIYELETNFDTMENRKLDYSERRDLELTRAFLSMLKGNDVYMAVRKAVNSPCSRFWISPEYASKRISALLRGKRYTEKRYRANRELIIHDIMKRCDGDYSMGRIESVVYSPAPRFYLTESTAKIYIYRALKQKTWKRK